MRYRTLNRRIYFGFLGSIVFFYCAYYTFLMTYYHQPRRTMCEVVTPFLGPAYPFFTFGNFAINMLSALVYIVIWKGLRSQADSTVMRRILKSLFIVVAIDLSGCSEYRAAFDAFMFRRKLSLLIPSVSKNGEWRMENGEWRMENGEWRMENGEWRMENGEWRMENGE
ncbi:hypothetical protein PRIPAC_81660 [Pristionchus pacificus]|uniref:G protein-coupled receptor n=1 Tax=Pristionchus pacificus TaxID=54126 RepID=A0A2A6CNI5_PRIPA|nr:hypothetical protein PRIPAC_81660 [Pristionchus pacificus]|eukprot:PDM79666.1 G protein-coupled receptor [Pristionchus pacificus]